jgi:hypothetical protein
VNAGVVGSSSGDDDGDGELEVCFPLRTEDTEDVGTRGDGKYWGWKAVGDGCS